LVNNPNPSPGSPNYGYEFWMTVAGNTPEGDITVKDFEGGLHAVRAARVCRTSVRPGRTGLLAETTVFLGQHQWLEEHLAFRMCPTTSSC
jgi:hypothetical protein